MPAKTWWHEGHSPQPPDGHSSAAAKARAEPARYLVLDADRLPERVTREIQERIRELLPDPVPSVAEANTGDFPAVREEVLTPTPYPPDRRTGSPS